MASIPNPRQRPGVYQADRDHRVGRLATPQYRTRPRPGGSRQPPHAGTIARVQPYVVRRSGIASMRASRQTSAGEPCRTWAAPTCPRRTPAAWRSGARARLRLREHRRGSLGCRARQQLRRIRAALVTGWIDPIDRTPRAGDGVASSQSPRCMHSQTHPSTRSPRSAGWAAGARPAAPRPAPRAAPRPTLLLAQDTSTAACSTASSGRRHRH
jgi:hypothetical protein